MLTLKTRSISLYSAIEVYKYGNVYFVMIVFEPTGEMWFKNFDTEDEAFQYFEELVKDNI